MTYMLRGLFQNTISNLNSFKLPVFAADMHQYTYSECTIHPSQIMTTVFAVLHFQQCFIFQTNKKIKVHSTIPKSYQIPLMQPFPVYLFM